MQVKKSKREDLMILKKMHRCDDCQKVFASEKSLYQHLRKKHEKEPTLSQPKFRMVTVRPNLFQRGIYFAI